MKDEALHGRSYKLAKAGGTFSASVGVAIGIGVAAPTGLERRCRRLSNNHLADTAVPAAALLFRPNSILISFWKTQRNPAP